MKDETFTKATIHKMFFFYLFVLINKRLGICFLQAAASMIRSMSAFHQHQHFYIILILIRCVLHLLLHISSIQHIQYNLWATGFLCSCRFSGCRRCFSSSVAFGVGAARASLPRWQPEVSMM